MKIDLAMPTPVEIDNLQRIAVTRAEITRRLHTIPTYHAQPVTYVLHLKYLQMDFVAHIWRELCHIDTAILHDKDWRAEKSKEQEVKRTFTPSCACSIRVELEDLICEESLPFFLRKMADYDFQEIKVIEIVIVAKEPTTAVLAYKNRLIQKNIPTKIVTELTNGVHVATLKKVGVFSDKEPANCNTIQPESVDMTI
jgi:hypothetical protein